MCKKKGKGFTLIELLIVVAIIAILAAIAVPNFMEAQVRAKISRVKADMRSIGTAIESYRVDNNDYPPSYAAFGEDPNYPSGSKCYIHTLIVLSTPVAYITRGLPVDPFVVAQPQEPKTLLSYEVENNNNQLIDFGGTTSAYLVNPNANTGGYPTKGMWWWLDCRGPNLAWAGFSKTTSPAKYIYESDTKPGAWLNQVYDSTNGTRSAGNIYRSGGGQGCFAGRSMNL